MRHWGRAPPERPATRAEQRDLLREGQAFSYREFAEALGISPGATKQLLFRSRQDLRVRYLALAGEPLTG